MALIGWRARQRGERVFTRVLAVGLAVAGGSALIVASCLDRPDSSRSLDEPAYVETTSARAPTDSSSGPAAPATIVVPAAQPAPVNITVNNELPTGTTITTGADQPVAGHASHAANDPAQNPNLQQLQQQPLVPVAPLVAPDALVEPGNDNRNSTPAPPYGSSSVPPSPTNTPSTPIAPAPTSTSQFSTDWGPYGSGYTTPNPNMGAGEFKGGNGPTWPY